MVGEGVGVVAWTGVDIGVGVGVRALIGDGITEATALAFPSFSASIMRAESSLGDLPVSIKNSIPRVATKVIAAIKSFIFKDGITVFEAMQAVLQN